MLGLGAKNVADFYIGLMVLWSYPASHLGVWSRVKSFLIRIMYVHTIQCTRNYSSKSRERVAFYAFLSFSFPPFRGIFLAEPSFHYRGLYSTQCQSPVTARFCLDKPPEIEIHCFRLDFSFSHPSFLQTFFLFFFFQSVGLLFQS